MHTKLTSLLLMLILCVVIITPSAAGANPRGKLYVIGMGPAGPATATLQAMEVMGKMDALLVSALVNRLFAKKLEGKKILFDHLTGLWDYKGRFFTTLSPTDMVKFKKERVRLTAERVKRINDLLAQGKNIGMLEGGNPMVFSSCHWYTERMDPKDVIYIPGMGSAAAGMAAIGRSVIPAYETRFLLQSAPFVITDEKMPSADDFKGLAKFQPTMILYMALKKPAKLFAALAKAFSPETPCAVVFHAGYPDKQMVLRGILGDMPGQLAKQKENYLGLLFVGNFLEGKPYLAFEDKP